MYKVHSPQIWPPNVCVPHLFPREEIIYPLGRKLPSYRDYSNFTCSGNREWFCFNKACLFLHVLPSPRLDTQSCRFFYLRTSFDDKLWEFALIKVKTKKWWNINKRKNLKKMCIYYHIISSFELQNVSLNVSLTHGHIRAWRYSLLSSLIESGNMQYASFHNLKKKKLGRLS